MRLRLFAASLAAALAVALCAVPAFADTENYTLLNGDYGSVSVIVNNGGSDVPPSSFAVGMYRISEGVQLVCLLPEGVELHPSLPNWQIKVGSDWVDTEIPGTQPYLATSTGDFRLRLKYGSANWPIVQYTVTSLGEVGNSTTGLFGIVTEGVGFSIDSFSEFLDAVLDEPILIFFCLALPLLTIGITIIRRLLATRA